MTAFRLEGPRFYAWDPATGNPLAGAKVYFYEKGTTTLKTTWSDQDKTSANTNPVILNAAGEAAIYLDGDYKVRLDDAADVTVWTQDGISSALDTVAVQSLIDITIATVMPTYPTQAALAVATVANTIERVAVQGYSNIHDAGGIEFIRVSSAPAHLLRVRSTDRFLPGGATDSADGGWWEVAIEGYSPLVAGAVGDGVTDDTVAINAVNDAAAPSKHVDLVGRTYEYVGTFAADAAISFTNGKIVDDATTWDFFAVKSVTGSGMIVVTEPSPGVVDVDLPEADIVTIIQGEVIATLTVVTSMTSTSGTSIDFANLPAGIDQFIVSLNAVSINAVDELMIHLGDSGGYETTGYDSTAWKETLTTNKTNGFAITSAESDTLQWDGNILFTRIAGNKWVMHGILQSGTGAFVMSAGSKTLSGELTQVRITTDGGTAAFDGGTIGLQHMRS